MAQHEEVSDTAVVLWEQIAAQIVSIVGEVGLASHSLRDGRAGGLALVSTIINLAHSPKFKVMAESVETEEQSSLPRLLDCDGVQDYLFNQPIPDEIFKTRYLRRLPPAAEQRRRD
jgi:predicted signal transduction protein with EAL and GGDEF domain